MALGNLGVVGATSACHACMKILVLPWLPSRVVFAAMPHPIACLHQQRVKARQRRGAVPPQRAPAPPQQLPVLCNLAGVAAYSVDPGVPNLCCDLRPTTGVGCSRPRDTSALMHALRHGVMRPRIAPACPTSMTARHVPVAVGNFVRCQPCQVTAARAPHHWQVKLLRLRQQLLHILIQG